MRKLRPDGSESFAWDGEVLRCDEDGIVLRAAFNVDIVEREYVTLRRGDLFIEFYYWDRAYNVFNISTPEGTFKGWYCNVGLPPHLDGDSGQLSYIDLALDLWVNPNGNIVVLDEDEFDVLVEQYPEFAEAARQGRTDVLNLAQSGALPGWPS